MSKIKKTVVFFMVLLCMTLLFPVVGSQSQVSAKKRVGLNYTTYKIKAGYSFKLKVKGTKKKVKWSSSKKKIATVTKKGKVKTKKAGKCVITAKVGKKKYKCKVTVTKNKYQVKPTTTPTTQKEFTAVTLNVDAVQLDVNSVKYNEKGTPVLAGEKGTFKLSLLNSSKTPEWKTSNAGVATVNGGTVTAVAAGKCSVSAVLDGKEYTAQVTVTDLKDAAKIANQENILYMLGRLNKDRVALKAAPVKLDTGLCKVADIRADELEKSFSHTRPNGTSYKTAYDDAGVPLSKYGTLGETVALCSDRVEYVGEFPKVSYDTLYASKSHREIMMNPVYNSVGIGYDFVEVYHNANGNLATTSYWALEFSVN